MLFQQRKYALPIFTSLMTISIDLKYTSFLYTSRHILIAYNHVPNIYITILADFAFKILAANSGVKQASLTVAVMETP